MERTPATSGISRLVCLFIAVSLLAAVGCNQSSTQTGNESNANESKTPSAANNANTASSKPEQPKTGSIEVGSSPPGARVLLVPNDESGAGEPQAKGVTPTTITGLAPGQYTVDLEKPGYRFFQKEVTVKAGSTAKVTATLRRQ